MASTNQSPFYKQAEVKFLTAKTIEEKIMYLEEMIRECPKHKSSEKMLANLKTRLKKLLEQLEKSKKSGKSRSKKGIKKEEMQAVIVGFTKTGKSSLMHLLTNAKPEIAQYSFTTKTPVVGIMDCQGTPIQLIEIPAIDSEYYDKGIVNTADTILILINNLDQIKPIEEKLEKSIGEKLIVYNISSEFENIRKIESTLKTKKYNFVIINIKNKINLEELKEKIFRSFKKIRIYTKEPGKEKSKNPLIMPLNSSIKDIAEKILRHSINNLKETKIWGPSSKFPGQLVGLNHVLKDLDVVEFRIR